MGYLEPPLVPNLPLLLLLCLHVAHHCLLSVWTMLHRIISQSYVLRSCAGLIVSLAVRFAFLHEPDVHAVSNTKLMGYVIKGFKWEPAQIDGM